MCAAFYELTNTCSKQKLTATLARILVHMYASMNRYQLTTAIIRCSVKFSECTNQFNANPEKYMHQRKESSQITALPTTSNEAVAGAYSQAAEAG